MGYYNNHPGIAAPPAPIVGTRGKKTRTRGCVAQDKRISRILFSRNLVWVAYQMTAVDMINLHITLLYMSSLLPAPVRDEHWGPI